MTFVASLDSPEQQLLGVIKRHGALSLAGIAAQLTISQEAARQRVNRLAHLGLVQKFEQRKSGGRPLGVWELSAKGHARFPDAHAQLSVQLLDAALSLHGNEGIEQLLTAREHAITSKYEEALASAVSLEERLQQLVELRDAEGYMARLETIESGKTWRLIEDHCPIGAAAASCSGFCASETRLFQAILGDGVGVTREEHIQQGEKRCAYKITALTVSC
ncbi:helix-turn-helix transcriptional regulator [Carnimonas bestiolae]|uniref:helix-turn-helix transcriptional regulator n=1 Tax=Carnimonas bestiolae TaxID=3402172 RepID=UPI003EDBE7C5